MENIKEFPCGILDPVISKADSAYGGPQRALDPGPKLQASNSKRQAPSLESFKQEASSPE
jgi:hypothetical protein